MAINRGSSTGLPVSAGLPGQGVPVGAARPASYSQSTAGSGQFAASVGEWTEQPKVIRRRMIVMAEATEKCGKTHFALTAPAAPQLGEDGRVREGIGYFGFDVGGAEGVIEKFRNGVVDRKRIFTCECRVPVPKGAAGLVYDIRNKAETEAIAEAAEEVWQTQWSRYLEALGRFRTIVYDTGTELNNLLILAKFGKQLEIMPTQRGKTNAIMEEMISMAYSAGVNLIMLHKMAESWENNVPTGKLKNQGYKNMVYRSQVNVKLGHDYVEPPMLADGQTPNPDAGRIRFTAMIKPNGCRPNPDAEGLLFVQPTCGFADVAMEVWPGTAREDWL